MLGMHHRRAGYPFGTLTDFASDGAGFPVFCLSPLAIHTRNIIEDPRCSLVVQLPGWTGLANARVTIFGDVFQLPPELQESAKEVFLQKQARASNKLRSREPVLHVAFLTTVQSAWAAFYYVGWPAGDQKGAVGERQFQLLQDAPHF